MLNGQKMNVFPLGSDETKMSLFTTSSQHFTGDSSQGNSARKGNETSRLEKKKYMIALCR